MGLGLGVGVRVGVGVRAGVGDRVTDADGVATVDDPVVDDALPYADEGARRRGAVLVPRHVDERTARGAERLLVEHAWVGVGAGLGLGVGFG